MDTPASSEPWDLIVVGGGLEGLTAAWAHARPNRRVLVLEAGPRIGGRNRTSHVEGFLLEEDLPHLSAPTRPLLDAVLGADAPTRVSPTPAVAGLLGPRGRVRLPGSFAPTRVVNGRVPLSHPRRLPPTAAQLDRRATGLNAFVEAATRASYGAGARDVGAGDAYPEALAMRVRYPRRPLELRLLHPCLDDETAVVRGGSSRLADALAASENVTVRTNQRVQVIQRDDVVVVWTEDRALRAHHVLLAVDAGEQAHLLRPDHPADAESLAAIPHTERVTLHLGLSPASARRLPRRLGILSLDPRPARIRGAAFVSLLDAARAPAGHALVHAWFGDGPQLDLSSYEDGLLLRIARADLARALGFEPEVVFHRITRRARAHPVPVPGLRGRLARVQAGLAGRGVGLLGRHMRGVDLTARLGIHVLRTRPRPLRL